MASAITKREWDRAKMKTLSSCSIFFLLEGGLVWESRVVPSRKCFYL